MNENKTTFKNKRKEEGETRGEGNKELELSTGKQHATASATTANRVHNLRKDKEDERIGKGKKRKDGERK